MGFIRGGLLVIVSVLLLLSFIAGNLFLTMSMSLDYDVVKPEITSFLQDMYEQEVDLGQIAEENLPEMKSYCENNTEFVFSEQGQTIVVPCTIISEGSEAVITNMLNSFVEDSYYKEYNCEFWKCVAKEPISLVSQKSKDYLHSKFYLALIVSIVLIVLIFFLAENKSNLFIIAGSLLAVSALPFMKLSEVLIFFMGKRAQGNIGQVATILFSKSYTIFITVLIIGIIILAVGIILHFFKIGFKISDFFNRKAKAKQDKQSKNVSKEEVKKMINDEVSKKK